jgi:predicted short-subunit dehydrogenase-like oxidoreductase (DUF2520 family)
MDRAVAAASTTPGRATPAIAIAGAGPVGQALGRLLAARGMPVVAVASRSRKHALEAAAFVGDAVVAVEYDELFARADRILVAVSDSALPEVSAALASRASRGIALHTCGACGPAGLAALLAAGVSCGALHPLQTVPTAEQGFASLVGIAWGVTAEGAAAGWAAEIVACLEGRVLRVSDAHRGLYHAGAVMASNYVLGLLDAAGGLMERAGIDRHDAMQALAPLLDRSVRNALASGLPDALTGPIVRGDCGTIERHVAALRAAPAGVARLYAEAGRYLLPSAFARGVPADIVREIERLLAEAEETT